MMCFDLSAVVGCTQQVVCRLRCHQHMTTPIFLCGRVVCLILLACCVCALLCFTSMSDVSALLVCLLSLQVAAQEAAAPINNGRPSKPNRTINAHHVNRGPDGAGASVTACAKTIAWLRNMPRHSCSEPNLLSLVCGLAGTSTHAGWFSKAFADGGIFDCDTTGQVSCCCLSVAQHVVPASCVVLQYWPPWLPVAAELHEPADVWCDANYACVSQSCMHALLVGQECWSRRT